MEVIVAKTAGFCFGVKRAVEKVYEQTEAGDGPIYTYGPIIHNEEVVRDLEERGVRVLSTEEELEALESGVVVIRSHGVSRRVYNLLAGQRLHPCQKRGAYLCQDDQLQPAGQDADGQRWRGLRAGYFPALRHHGRRRCGRTAPGRPWQHNVEIISKNRPWAVFFLSRFRNALLILMTGA